MISKLTYLLASLLLLPGIASLKLDTTNHWKNFKETFNRSYDTEEEKLRSKIFSDNVHFISMHNLEADLGAHTYYLGLNHMSDLTHDEYLKAYGSCLKTEAIEPKFSKSTIDSCEGKTDIPESFDYTKENMVTSVKDQGHCGSCYAFATIAVVETTWKKYMNKLRSLSAQNILDCSGNYGNNGCNGGYIPAALEYMEDNGVATEKSYPYEGKNGNECRVKGKTVIKIGAKISKFDSIEPNLPDEMKTVLATIGPLAVSLNAGMPTFRHYKSGIYSDPDCHFYPNHAVAIVGYGKDEDDEFWIVKNSWGTTWGEDGYLRISRSTNNTCGINSTPVYVTIDA